MRRPVRRLLRYDSGQQFVRVQAPFMSTSRDPPDERDRLIGSGAGVGYVDDFQAGDVDSSRGPFL